MYIDMYIDMIIYFMWIMSQIWYVFCFLQELDTSKSIGFRKWLF